MDAWTLSETNYGPGGDCFNENTNRSFTAGAANSSITLSDCFGSCGECQFDCTDTWNGTAEEDNCGVCGGDNSTCSRSNE